MGCHACGVTARVDFFPAAGRKCSSCLDKNIKWLGNKELGKAVYKVSARETQGRRRLSH